MKSYPTVIHSNGSKFAGEEPESIEKLLEILEKYPLDIIHAGACGFLQWENCENNEDYKNSKVFISGNFINYSHVFNIEGEYENLRPLITAIENNIKNQFK